jgi:hypothetical protein
VEPDVAKREALIKAALREWKEQVHTIPLHRQVIPWAARSNVNVVHRADNWLEVPWITIARGELLHRRADAGGLVDAALLADRQVHRQVQEGIGAPVLHRVAGGQRRFEVGQVGAVLRVLLRPLRSQQVHRCHRFAADMPRPGLAEESPHVVLGWLEHAAFSRGCANQVGCAGGGRAVGCAHGHGPCVHNANLHPNAAGAKIHTCTYTH